MGTLLGGETLEACAIACAATASLFEAVAAAFAEFASSHTAEGGRFPRVIPARWTILEPAIGSGPRAICATSSPHGNASDSNYRQQAITQG